MRAAWALTDAELAEQRLALLAGELDRTWPDAAGSLREGSQGHADADALEDHRQARPDALLDERLRVDDRDRPLQPSAT